MDEATMAALIAEGETERIDFKRELALDTARGRAELVKDVVAIANSAPQGGYILIGVDDSKLIVGIAGLEEERIQQIVHAHITPSIDVGCSVVCIHTAGFPSVGVLTVWAPERPVKVARAIEHLNQDDVFVRRGSTTSKASPEEIVRMHQESQSLIGIARYIRSAEVLLELGNLQDAISAYTIALSSEPTSQLFLARGKARALLVDASEPSRATSELKTLAFQDFSSAVRLANSFELEKEARLGRMRMYSTMLGGDAEYAAFLEDLEWFRARTEGREQGEALFWNIKTWNDATGLNSSCADEAFATIDRAIELGYTEPEAYYLRAVASFYACNYGLALADIDRLTEMRPETDDLVIRLLRFRSEVLANMGRFREARQSLSQAYKLPGGRFDKTWAYRLSWGLLSEILNRFSLDYKYGDLDQSEVDFVRLYQSSIETPYFSETYQ